MARRSKNKNLRSKSQRNISNSITNRRLLGPIKIRSLAQMQLDVARLTGQDQRAYNPIKKLSRPLQTVRGLPVSTTVNKKTPLKYSRLQIVLPKETTLCVRRGMRKEVLFAKKLTSKGSKSRRRITPNSKVKC